MTRTQVRSTPRSRCPCCEMSTQSTPKLHASPKKAQGREPSPRAAPAKPTRRDAHANVGTSDCS